MSDQLIGTLKAFTGTNNAGSIREIEAGVPTTEGKTESPAGKPLPLEAAYEERDLESVAQSLTLVSQNIGRDLKFIVDLKSAQPIIQVLDSETGEVIRQIPASELDSYALKNGAEGIRMLDTMA